MRVFIAQLNTNGMRFKKVQLVFVTDFFFVERNCEAEKLKRDGFMLSNRLESRYSLQFNKVKR